MGREVTLAAPAKLNLHLGIHDQLDERRYHRVDSVMIAVGLADVVRVREGCPGLSVSMTQDVGASPQKNTALVAARRLCSDFGREERYEILVEKRVPAQGGLGGSSTDAAAVIRALCSLWGEDVRDERVVRVARSVGADVPFFLDPRPSYLAGAGDDLVRAFPNMSGLPVVLVMPSVGVSTPEAYAEFDRHPTAPRSPEAICRALAAGRREEIPGLLYSNLEPAAFRLVGEGARVKEWLLGQRGVRGCQLTGSGSCVFAICEDGHAARRIASAARAVGDWWSSSCETVGLDALIC